MFLFIFKLGYISGLELLYNFLDEGVESNVFIDLLRESIYFE